MQGPAGPAVPLLLCACVCLRPSASPRAHSCSFLLACFVRFPLALHASHCTCLAPGLRLAGPPQRRVPESAAADGAPAHASQESHLSEELGPEGPEEDDSFDLVRKPAPLRASEDPGSCRLTLHVELPRLVGPFVRPSRRSIRNSAAPVPQAGEDLDDFEDALTPEEAQHGEGEEAESVEVVAATDTVKEPAAAAVLTKGETEGLTDQVFVGAVVTLPDTPGAFCCLWHRALAARHVS